MRTCPAFLPAVSVALTALFFVLPAVSPGEDGEPLATPAAATASDTEFTVLFNGKTLDDKWQHSGNWTVADGAISRKGKGGSLIWKGSTIPDDFELQFEWKVATGANSGVYYRPGQYEYQILDNSMHPDGDNPRTSAASLYFCVAPSKDATRPVGEWNEARIICQGTIIQHWLNGEKVIDFDYADPKNAAAVELLRLRGADLTARGGHLSLQDHGDPVWYRNLKLRAIASGEKVEHTQVTPAEGPAKALEKEQMILKRIRQNREAQRRAAGAN